MLKQSNVKNMFDLKEFVKPSHAKFAVLLTLFLVSSYASQIFGANPESKNPPSIGFPFIYYDVSVLAPQTSMEGPSSSVLTLGFVFLAFAFLLNVAFWYVVSCAVVLLYNKMMKK